MIRPLLSLLVLMTACTTVSPAKLRVLEADRRAKQVQLETLRRAGEADLRLRDLRRAALARSRAIRSDTFDGEGAFLLIRQAWFEQVVEAVMPIKLKAGGFGWRFRDPEVELTPDGVRVRLALQVINKRVKKRLGRPAGGHIVGVLTPERDPDLGRLHLIWRPLQAKLDDRDFRVSNVVFKSVGMDAFEGLIPPLPIPLGPSDAVECCGKRIELQVALDPADAVVLREGLLLPFTIRLDTVAALPAAKPEETP